MRAVSCLVDLLIDVWIAVSRYTRWILDVVVLICSSSDVQDYSSVSLKNWDVEPFLDRTGDDWPRIFYWLAKFVIIKSIKATIYPTMHKYYVKCVQFISFCILRRVTSKKKNQYLYIKHNWKMFILSDFIVWLPCYYWVHFGEM